MGEILAILLLRTFRGPFVALVAAMIALQWIELQIGPFPGGTA